MELYMEQKKDLEVKDFMFLIAQIKMMECNFS